MPLIEPFGVLPSGEQVMLATLSTSSGASVRITNYGGIVTSLLVPDRKGALADVVLGFESLDSYLGAHPFFGATVGRVAGRIPDGRIEIDGRVYQLPLNEPPNHLHGGFRGFDKRLWEMEIVKQGEGLYSVRLQYDSLDGEEGYPGNASVCVSFTFTESHELVIDTMATTDRPTPLSLTHHSYFNLTGEGSGDVLDHRLTIHANEVVDVDDAMTPLGTLRPVAGKAADFNSERVLREAVPGLFQQHGDLYKIRGPLDGKLKPAACLHDPFSERVLNVTTTLPMLQFYSGASLDGSLVGKSGRPYSRHAGVCLECEGYPAAATPPELGNIMVRPGTPQMHRTIYAFSNH